VPLQPIETRRLYRHIAEQVAGLIARGEFPPGSRLPTERELAQRFGVPRSTVRKTLAQLEADGAITRHVGRGTFIAGAAAPLAASVADTSPAELMEARLRIEPAVVELIVTNATAADFARMETCIEKAERAATLDEFEMWDAALHQALATATHNRFVSRILEMVAAVREQAEWGKLKDRIVTPERRLKYQEEHREIVRALKSRDAAAARLAVLAHLQHAHRNLFEY